MFARKIILISITLFVFGLACTPAQKSESKSEIAEAVDTIEKESKEEWNQLKANMTSLRNDLDNEMEELDNKLENATGEAKEELLERKRKVDEWRVDVDKRMDKMGDKISEEWQDIVEDSKAFFKEVRKDLDS